MIWRNRFLWKLILRFPLTLWVWNGYLQYHSLKYKMIKRKIEKNMPFFFFFWSYYCHFHFLPQSTVPTFQCFGNYLAEWKNTNWYHRISTKYFKMLFLSFILFSRVFNCSTFELHLHKLDICSMPSVKC